MKARFLIIAILAMAACQRVELDDPTAPEVITSDADSVCTLTLRASMNESQTKALDLVNDGTRINAYWRNTEKVKVYKGGTFLGTLNVVPDAGERPTQATLSGSITITDLAAGDELTLRIPRENWDYTRQTGTLESISNAYSYATASVTIDSVDNTKHTVITTNTAHFQNQQSIYRFEFKRKGNVQIQTRALTVMAANGKLVQRVSYEGGAFAAVSAQGRNMIDFTVDKGGGQYLYFFKLDNIIRASDYYMSRQREAFLNHDNFVEIEPVVIDNIECSRYAYLGEDGEPLAYVVEGIGFDSYDMGDLLTPFTRKPDPNADYQEWCGLCHVVKDGRVIYKGMRYTPDNMTGIDEVVADQRPRQYDAYYYDLMGRRVGTEVPMTPGIYIHNGKKICVSQMP